MPEARFSDADVDAAIAELSDPERFRIAEARVAQLAPQLQRILARALHEGGWFGEAHESQLLKAATTPAEDERIAALRTLIAEETRVGMMVGVAVGWELGRELERGPSQRDSKHSDDSRRALGRDTSNGEPGSGPASETAPREAR